jgi:8-oxo-dGTP diphosphatase
MGWEQFSALIDGLPLPVYAIGGMKSDDNETAWAHGAQGVAGIGDFWKISG